MYAYSLPQLSHPLDAAQGGDILAMRCYHIPHFPGFLQSLAFVIHQLRTQDSDGMTCLLELITSILKADERVCPGTQKRVPVPWHMQHVQGVGGTAVAWANNLPMRMVLPCSLPWALHNETSIPPCTLFDLPTKPLQLWLCLVLPSVLSVYLF